MSSFAGEERQGKGIIYIVMEAWKGVLLQWLLKWTAILLNSSSINSHMADEPVP
jgi:hypothetical protein